MDCIGIFRAFFLDYKLFTLSKKAAELKKKWNTFEMLVLNARYKDSKRLHWIDPI